MKISVKECADTLKEKDNILILTHANPDGDTLGSGFALCRALMKIGKICMSWAKKVFDIFIITAFLVFIENHHRDGCSCTFTFEHTA